MQNLIYKKHMDISLSLVQVLVNSVESYRNSIVHRSVLPVCKLP